jgi:hypothetical protein
VELSGNKAEIIFGFPRRLLARLKSSRAFRGVWRRGGLRFLMPAYMAGLRLRNRHPVVFDEKVKYEIARDRRPMLTSFCDKLDARSYVSRVLGPGHVPEVLAEARRAADLPWADLPQEMAVKTNHGSGACVLIWKGAEPSALVPEATIKNAWTTSIVQPSAADPQALAAFLDMNLKLNYYWMYGEWGYRHVRPRAFAEEFLVGSDDGRPSDCRCYVFNGTCDVVVVTSAIETDSMTTDFFLPDWTHLQVMRRNIPNNAVTPRQPPELPEILEMAGTPGRETDFLRVDFLLSGGRILVGELTNYPYAGRVPTEPPEFDRWLGSRWDQPKNYRDLPQASYPR